MFTCLTQILPLFSVTTKRRTRSLQMHTRKMSKDRYSDLGKDLHSSPPQTRLWVRSCMKREPTQPTNQNHHTLLPPPKASTDAHQQKNIGSGNPQETVFIFHVDHPCSFHTLKENAQYFCCPLGLPGSNAHCLWADMGRGVSRDGGSCLCTCSVPQVFRDSFLNTSRGDSSRCSMRRAGCVSLPG